MMVRDIANFAHGIINRLEKQSIPVGSLANALNFRTRSDKVELRAGSAVLGDDLGSGGKSHGVHTAYKADGTPVLFRKRGRKLEYFLSGASAWAECGTDLFPAAAEEDDASFANYQSLSGAQLFISSPNSSIYKIMVANPGSYSDMASADHRGNIRVHKNRLFLVDRRGSNFAQDRTGFYLSWIDNQQYTTVSAEAVGALGGTNYSYTLAYRSGQPKRTCFGVVIKIGGTVKFTDDYNGNLVAVDGPAFGSGTVNYTTGEITLTLAAAASGAITADYQWEDSSNEGIADFSYSATRVAGEGDVLRQDEGGTAHIVEVYDDVYFVFHERSIYRTILSADDTDADNNPFRSGVGVPNPRATAVGPNGIYFVDTATKTDPQIRYLTISAGSDKAKPVSISEQIDLSALDFDDCWMRRIGTTLFIGCRTKGESVNNRLLIYEEIFQTWDIADLYSRTGDVFVIDYGDEVAQRTVLVIGDSLSENVYEAFTGVDDNDAIVPGFVELNQWDLDMPDRLKKTKDVAFEGDIALTQIIDVLFNGDDSGFVKIGQIRGDGSYVDKTRRATLGGEALGGPELGGGGDGREAYHYFVQLSGRLIEKFQKGTVRLAVGEDEDTGEAGIGYFSCSLVRFQDIRIKESKIPRKYRT